MENPVILSVLFDNETSCHSSDKPIRQTFTTTIDPNNFRIDVVEKNMYSSIRDLVLIINGDEVLHEQVNKNKQWEYNDTLSKFNLYKDEIVEHIINAIKNPNRIYSITIDQEEILLRFW